MLPSNHDRMTGPDFFFSPSATIAASTGNSGEDDDWGEFVDSSDVINSLSSKPNGIFTDRNGSDSAPNRIESEDKKIHAKWVTSRGPVPLSVFGEEEDESGASVSSFNFSFDSFSSKRNNGAGSVSRVVNTNPIEGISSLIPNMCRESGQRELTNGLNSPGNNRGHLEMKDKESLSSRRIDDLAVSMENLNWNPLSLDTEKSEKTSSVVNSNAIGIMLDPNFSDFRFLNKYEDDDDDVDDWKFKTAESMYGMADGGYKEEQEKKTKSGSVLVQNTTNLSSSVWSLPTNGTGRNFEDAVESVFNGENGDDDPWDNGGWEFKVAEVKNDLTNKESNGWSYEFGSEIVSKIETTTSLQSNFDKEPQKRENDSISLSNTANMNSGVTSWAFKQPSLENGNEKEEKEVQKDKPKGLLPLSFFEDEKLGNSDILVHEDNLVSVCDFPVREKPMAPSPTVSIKDKPKGLLPLSFFEDEKLGNSDILVHEDNLVSVCDFPVREKPKAPSPTVSINDLITSLYSQVENNAVNLSEKPDAYGFVTVKAETDSNLVNGEDDSWEFQGPKKTITDSSIVEGIDGFDSTWEFQGPSLALKNTVVTEDVDEFDDDSWEFQGPTQPVKDSTAREGENGSLEYKWGPMENEGGNPSPGDGFQELHEKPVISIKPSDYQDFFLKLRTELYDIALHHLETLKDARDMGAEFVEALDNEKRNSEIDVLQNWLNNDVLRSEVNLESLQPKSSGITELSKALQEPKFRAIVSEDGLSERLLLAGKDWKSSIELLKHATLTLKILNLGSPEQQSEYASTWFVIASACAQELRHAASIWKQVIENDVQEEILSKPQGKSYSLSVGEIYRVAKILRASIRLYKPWIILNPSSYNVLEVLDECVKLWSSSGLEEALRNSFNRQGLDCDYSADQFLKSIKFLDEVDAFTLHTCITSTTSPICYISGLNSELLPGIKMLEWNGNPYLLPLANLWANLISRDPPSLRGHHFPTIS